MPSEIETIFTDSGALLQGHFLLNSGLHSPVYWEKFRILQYPDYTMKVCRLIADHFRSQKVQMVAGPTTGGIILAYEVGRQLGVRGIFAEKDEPDKRVFRRGFHVEPGERVLIVDDVLTSGKSVREMIAAVSESEGRIMGIGVMVYRGEKEIDLGYPFFYCYRSPEVAYGADKCPLCAKGIPLVKPGAVKKN
jgi:orotate phosphoribosyltransferase